MPSLQNLTENPAFAWSTTMPAPEDGAEITADANDGMTQGPVNPAFQELLDRDAMVALGTVTLKSVTVDGIGEQDAGAPAAGLISTTGDIVAVGDIQAGQSVEAGTEHLVRAAASDSHLDHKAVSFDDIDDGNAAGANPPYTEAIPNQLRAINIPKAWALLRTADAGYPGYFVDGCGFTGASIATAAGPVSTITFTLASAMASDQYVVQPWIIAYGTRLIVSFTKLTRLSATQFVLEANLDFTNNYEVEVWVFGRQIT
jgi:hypothetical protein